LLKCPVLFELAVKNLLKKLGTCNFFWLRKAVVIINGSSLTLQAQQGSIFNVLLTLGNNNEANISFGKTPGRSEKVRRGIKGYWRYAAMY
jgi:hypothetical protein